MSQAGSAGTPPEHQAYRANGWQPDRLVHDDQAIVNIVRYARRLTGVDRIHAVLGGFHRRDGDIIPATVAALAAESPSVVVPAHCTSWKAQQALAAGLPDSYRPNAVGSRFEL